jgi:hypothetical protein
MENKADLEIIQYRILFSPFHSDCCFTAGDSDSAVRTKMFTLRKPGGIGALVWNKQPSSSFIFKFQVSEDSSS